MDVNTPRWTPKPWGGEMLIRVTGSYVVKILHLRSGCRTSLQYHRVKRETLLPGSGRAVLEIHSNGQIEEHALLDARELPPGTIHRLVGLEDAEVVEVSSPELEDVVRLEDDYGRLG